MYVEVAVNMPPVRGSFHYHLPTELENRLQPGHLVTAPFGKRVVQGVVLRLLDQPDVPETRPIGSLLDPEPVLTPQQLLLARWMAERTLSPLIECLTLMLPPGLSQRADSLHALLDPEAQGDSAIQKRLISLLKKRGPLRGRQIDRRIPMVNWKPAANALLRQGVLSRTNVLDPPQVNIRKLRTVRLAVPPDAAQAQLDNLGRKGSQASFRRRAILEALILEREPMEVTWIYAQSGANSQDLRYLADRDLITFGETEVWRDPLEAAEYIPSDPLRLTRDQAAVMEVLSNRLRAGPQERGEGILLHGVTGSGKTEIYLQAVAETLDLGRSAIVLVPEIALTPQTVRRFLARFPGQVGLLHSKLSNGERYDTWRRCRSGSLRLVIGARSALFAPLPSIGLIVLDESHDDSYKEHAKPPRYHARETALQYAQIVKAVCLLGSATPDIGTSYRASRGQLERLSLPKRILGHRQRLESQSRRLGVKTKYKPSEGDAQSIDLPPVRLVDMRQELRSGNRSLFSRSLQEALTEVVRCGHQAILFLNRRGSATHVFCRDCGQPLRCPRCELSLTFHREGRKLLCHHCGYSRNLPEDCPQCGSTRIKHFGAGTQRLETEVTNLLPEARTLRWDRDATRAKGSHEIILAHFAAHRADVLIGTQMIAKSLDLPLVTLVGVVSADTALNLPDFRAAERTFQVLTQVAGRAGRGLLGGRVILQTYQPEHYAIRSAVKHDYEAFYREELGHRRALDYPPFSRLARLEFRHLSAQKAQAEAERLAAELRQQITKHGSKADLIGPAPCFFPRLRGLHRWQIIIRAKAPETITPVGLPRGWMVDIDPVSLL